MSRSKTKRREVWVNEYAGGPSLSVYAHRTRASALSGIGSAVRPVPFVEARPGDVVLSREQRKTLAVIVKWMDDSTDGRFKVIVEPELRAILRGGR